MAAESIIQGLVDYFMGCPLLKDGVFRMDALGEEAVEYTIETGIEILGGLIPTKGEGADYDRCNI